MKVITPAHPTFERLCNRGWLRNPRLEERVRGILESVRLHGDAALLRYTRKFDGVALTPKTLRVTEAEMSGAFQHIDPALIAHLKSVIQNVEQFYRGTLRKPWSASDENGVWVGERYQPIERVGIYIPAGTAPLVSTVYMTVLPAKIAGVPQIVLTTPPNRQGQVDPHILVMASLLKVKEIYRIGGAQAIGALAYGTKTIPRVDKIVGPGNAYVAEAKRQVFGVVSIDMMAGPSEVAIIAGRDANPDFVLADLQGEGEHAGGLSVLITPSRTLAQLARAKIRDGYVVMVKNLEEAAEVANRLAPEHLQLLVNNPARLLKKIRHAGAVFLGAYTPTSVGDYVAGPSHVLPTGGSARAFSGLGVADFLKRSHVIAYNKKALEAVKDAIQRLTALEGLPKHFDTVRIRLE